VIAEQSHPVEVAFDPTGLAVFESHHGTQFHMAWRTDAFPKVLLLIGGRGRLLLHDAEHPLQKGMALIIPSHTRHRIVDQPGKPLSLYALCFGPGPFPSPALRETVFAHLRLDDNEALHRELTRLLRLILLEQRRAAAGAQDLRVARAAQFLVAIAREPASSPTEVLGLSSQQRVARYLARMPQEITRQETLDLAARSVNLSRRRFSQIFKELTGESWQSYRQRLRMDHAASLLTSTELTVAAVAFECGFDDLTYFYRVFKATYRQTPAQFRQAKITA